MIKVHFPNADSERKAIGFLAGRFPFKTLSEGLTLVPESALCSLAKEGISFTVDGRATYDQIVSKCQEISR
jgi:hypothetical protein